MLEALHDARIVANIEVVILGEPAEGLFDVLALARDGSSDSTCHDLKSSKASMPTMDVLPVSVPLVWGTPNQSDRSCANRPLFEQMSCHSSRG